MGRHPYAGAAAFLFVYAGCSVLFIPGSVLTLGGSFLFGHSLGAGKGFVFAFIAVFTGKERGREGRIDGPMCRIDCVWGGKRVWAVRNGLWGDW